MYSDVLLQVLYTINNMSETGKMAGRVIVYSIVGCPHCKAAKFSLHEKDIAYVDVSIDQFESSVRERVKEATGKNTMPQIYFNGVLVGGNVELQKAVSVIISNYLSVLSTAWFYMEENLCYKYYKVFL